MEDRRPLTSTDLSHEGQARTARDEQSTSAVQLLPQRQQSRHCRRPGCRRGQVSVADPHWWAR